MNDDVPGFSVHEGSHMLHLRRFLATALLLASTQAMGYGAGYGIDNLGSLQFSHTINQIQWKQLERQRGRAAASSSASDGATRFAPASASAKQARILAQSYPPTHRAEAERVFQQMLTGYGKIERQFDIPRNDLAGAVAAFFAGSYMAYRNADFPDAHFKPLVAQMRAMLASQPGFAAASNEDKQQMYEQMAIVGMFMATTQMGLKSQPDAQLAGKLQAVGQAYLERFLQTSADRVQITSTGLSLK